MYRVARWLTAAALLWAVPVNAADFGVSYDSDWSQLYAKNAIDTADTDGTQAPYSAGMVRSNTITLHDSTGTLRAWTLACTAAMAEVNREDEEAASNGGWYHHYDVGVPGDVGNGGDTRLSFTWGSSNTWNLWSFSYSDETDSFPIGSTPAFWSFVVQVRAGSIAHQDWGKGNSDIIGSMELGPVLGYSLGRAGRADLVARLGAQLDPIFKPLAGLLIPDIPMLDTTVWAQLDGTLFDTLNIAGRVAYERGSLFTPGYGFSATASAGLYF